jgi:MFS family permease
VGGAGWVARGAGKPAPLLTGPFVLVCLATAFFYLSFYLILPVMPLYVRSLGGTPGQIGLIIGYFAFTAMLLRLPSGWLIDRRGARPILVSGMSVFFLASLGYTATTSVGAILGLRLFHGTGMGLFPTAAAVVVTELSPPERRGEAMGWFGIANSIGLIAGPAAGPLIASSLSFLALFLVAAALAGLGLTCVALSRTPAPRTRGAPGRVIGWQDVLSRGAVLPSLILLFLYIPYGALLAFVPLMATARGLENPGLFYTAFAVAMLLVRSQAGQISDRRGRVTVILPGLLVAAVALVLLGLASTPAGILTAAAIFGAGFGSVQPALMALTADRVAVADRGKAMGTFFTAWELGIAAGASAAGWLLTYTDFAVLLVAGALLPLAGAVVSLRARARER